MSPLTNQDVSGSVHQENNRRFFYETRTSFASREEEVVRVAIEDNRLVSLEIEYRMGNGRNTLCLKAGRVKYYMGDVEIIP